MKKKRILLISVFLVLAISMAVYCWPVSRSWFPDAEKIELSEVWIYGREVTDLLTEEQQLAILQCLQGLQSRRSMRYSTSYSQHDYSVSIYLWYAVDTPEMDRCQILLGRTCDVWSIDENRIYDIADGEALEAQLTELLSMYGQ